MTEPCPGVCNAAYRATGEGEPTMGDGASPWCGQDQARIRRQFAELDLLGALHAFTADGHREPTTEPIRGSGHAPSPSPAMDDIDELTRWVLDWEDAYRDLHPRWKAAETRSGYLAEARTEAIAWLCERMDGVLEAPFAIDFGREVAWWHRSLTAMTKAGSGKHKKLAPCPWCGERLLYRTDGDDYVACAAPGCRCRLTMDEYHATVGAARRNLEQVS